MNPTRICYIINNLLYNKQGVKESFLFTHVTLECLNFKRQNELQNAKHLLSTSIALSAIIAVEQLLEEMRVTLS